MVLSKSCAGSVALKKAVLMYGSLMEAVPIYGSFMEAVPMYGSLMEVVQAETRSSESWR